MTDPRKGEGPDARQRSEPSGTATMQPNCAPAEPNAQEVSGHASQMLKANELGVIFMLQAEEDVDKTVACSCCGCINNAPSMSPRVIVESGRWVVAFLCPKCEDGAKIKRVSLIDAAQVDPTLLAAYKWLDSKLLQRSGKKLFIRRPTFAERQKALATGVALPSGSAVVVSPHGEGHLGRRLMPMPFPWRDEQEWMAGPIAAQSAVDLADAIERGEVQMLEVGENAMFFASDKVLEGLVAGS